MIERCRRRVALALAAATLFVLAGAAGPASAQPGLAVGTEFQVNTYTNSNQRDPEVAINDSGTFVVVWESNLQDGSSYGIFGQRFGADGSPLGVEFRINTQTLLQQYDGAVALADGGGFVVVFHGASDGESYGVFARRYDAAGTPLASEIQVNTYTPGNQRIADVALDSSGGFVVVWESFFQDGADRGVFGQRFDSSGARLGTEFQVTTYTAGTEDFASIAVAPGGAFVVAWRGSHDGDLSGVFARRFDATGTALATELQINTFTTGAQLRASVAADATGSFVVAWESDQDGSGKGVFARRFSANGVPQASEFQVNAYTTGDQDLPSAAMDTDGGFVISWRSALQDGSSDGIFALRYESGGTPVATEFLVNSHTDGQQFTSAAAFEHGRFVVAWDSFGGQDGLSGGVFAQRYQELAVLDIDGNGTVAALTDGILVLRYLFGFTGATLVTGAFDVVGCTRCNAPAIEAYLGTLI